MERREKIRWSAALAVAAVVIAADQASKAWVLRHLPGQPPLTVVPGFFDLIFSRNTGGVFGLLGGAPSPGRRAFFAAATLAALGVIVSLLHRWGRDSRLLTVALALVAGGAVGNLVDRLRFGSVVDFIDWHWRGHHWYTFNVADSAITVGATLLFVHSLLPEPAATAAGRPGPLVPPEA
jgi:signal peptidase II